MKRIRPNELHGKLSEEELHILAEMAEEIPISNEWKEISKMLSDEQKFKVYEKRSEVQKNKEQARRAAMSEEEKAAEAAKWERIKNDPDPHKFYGNMGQPETPEQFKNRYGVWPPGYDKDGNKI